MQMNIRNRLKKLEKGLINDSTICACNPHRNTEIYLQDLGEDAPRQSEPKLSGEPVPDICLRCRKPIEKRKIILQLCDHTTKDRFPQEWNANRNK
jgi:hypothetical protein